MRVISILFFGLLAPFSLFAQNINPEEDEIFKYAELSEIHLTISANDKAFLLNPDNANSSVFFPATFRMKNQVMDTILQQQVGIRLRGNTSRQHEKQSYRIDFREYGGEKFFDYKKFNLKSDVNDPSLMREILTYDFYRKMNVPAPRLHVLKFFMNSEYMGVYLNVEVIDDEFIDKRFKHEDGFLYKCEYGANLRDNGQVFNQSIFDSQMNQSEDTRAELDNFVDVLNNVDASVFQTEIEKVFSVDRFLRQLAVEALLGHWDGYSYNKNNFYLFYDAQSKLVEFIPYDTDNTWGIDWVNRDWATRNLNQWYASGDPRPLTTKILSIPEYKWRYTMYIRELMDSYFKSSYILPKWNAHKELLTEAIAEDTYFSRAFGFTHADFLNAYTQAMNNHVKYGIQQYVDVRSTKAIEQIPALITSVELPEKGVGIPFPNPSTSSSFFVYVSSNFTNQPYVYTSTGLEVSVKFEKEGADWLVTMPSETVSGLYLVRIGNNVSKWIYAK